ncbi:VOC family protein [Acuticoccus mangrovi]|uniref:VOC family protein n=1 Tax=Acuticoccus mangrovi TaxID=2796142 RepID=A0A934MFF6_9HYPH|nr:VOC family protein [Acuticoccus mangrovi]MBJ3778617.1 VOC family protein [Acuticoccus mangrovi]
MSTTSNSILLAPYRLAHLNIFVSDLERSGKFYADVCGFKEVFREPGISMIFMSNGNTHHDLGLMETMEKARIGRGGHVQASSGRGRYPGLNHLGFEMETEKQLVDSYHRAQERGLKINRTTDHLIAHSLYLSELNGFTLEFYADVTDDWQAVYANNVGELISGDWDPDASEPFAERKGGPAAELFESGSAPIRARNVAYAGLPVKDLAASVAYYTEKLGMSVTSINEADKIAVLSGAEPGRCDVCLVETDEVPDVRLLFGGVQVHEGQPIATSLAALRAQGINATVIGDGDRGALVVLDPDGIPLVYSTEPASRLLEEHGASIVEEVARLKKMTAAAKSNVA